MSMEAVRLECARSLLTSQERRDGSDDHRTFIRNIDGDLIAIAICLAILAAITILVRL